MTTGSQPKFTVRVYRATRDVEAMLKFLKTVGFHEKVSGEEGLVYVYGRGGVIALFPAEKRFNRSEMSFETDDYMAAAELLTKAGRHLEIVEDEDGPGLKVTDARGHNIWISATHRPNVAEMPEQPIDLVVLWHSPDVDKDREFFEILNYSPEGQDALSSVIMHAPERQGSIAIEEGNPDGCEPGESLIQFGMAVDGSLDAIVERLKAGGYPVTDVIPLEDRDYIAVTDPDGVTVGIFGRRNA